MNFFNPTALERAQRNLDRARKNLLDAQQACTLAKVSLEDAGRNTQAAAIEMVCCSLEQAERDIIKWMELMAKTRENGNGG